MSAVSSTVFWCNTSKCTKKQGDGNPASIQLLPDNSWERSSCGTWTELRTERDRQICKCQTRSILTKKKYLKWSWIRVYTKHNNIFFWLQISSGNSREILHRYWNTILISCKSATILERPICQKRMKNNSPHNNRHPSQTLYPLLLLRLQVSD